MHSIKRIFICIAVCGKVLKFRGIYFYIYLSSLPDRAASGIGVNILTVLLNIDVCSICFYQKIGTSVFRLLNFSNFLNVYYWTLVGLAG
jgi:hypothetical protein